MENIRYMAVLKDGTEIELSIHATSLFDAAFEMLESIAFGELKVNPGDVLKIIDIPG